MQTPGNFQIYVKRNAINTVMFAAVELRNYCRNIFGQEFPIILCDSNIHEHSIILSSADKPSFISEKLIVEANELGHDGFIIKTSANSIVFIAAHSRGVLFAVYTFLEKYLNCRWYYPKSEDQLVPAQKTAHLQSIVNMDIYLREKPAFSFRMTWFTNAISAIDGVKTTFQILELIDWWAKLRMNCIVFAWDIFREDCWKEDRKKFLDEMGKRGMLAGVGGHGTYPLFLDPEIYAKTHPEWYCEINGTRIAGMKTPEGKDTQFCTSNKKAVQTFIENYIQFARENPEIEVFFPVPNDGGLWCECKSCRDKSIADRLLDLNNKLAEALCTVNSNYRIIHFAYHKHRRAPENIIPHQNVYIDQAVWGRDFAYPITDQRTILHSVSETTAATMKDYMQTFNQWVDTCQKQPNPAFCGEQEIQMIYHCKFMRYLWLGGLRLLPLPNLDADMLFFHSKRIAGFDFHLGFPGLWTKALNIYVIAQKTWQTGRKTKDIVEEYFRLYYEKNSADAQQAFELITEALPELRYGSCIARFRKTGMMGPEMNSDYRAVWDSAANATVKLKQALEIVNSSRRNSSSAVIQTRLRKLAFVIRNAYYEQSFLHIVTQLADIRDEIMTANKESSIHLLEKGKPLVQKVNDLADMIKFEYDISHDLDGLLWAGNICDRFITAAKAWRTFFFGWSTLSNKIITTKEHGERK